MFDFLTDSYFWLIAIGTGLLGVLNGTIGTFSFLRKESLMGDVIAHSVLPGVALAYIFFQSKNLLLLLVGGMVFGWLGSFFTHYLSEKSKLKTDTTFAIILSSFFALGIMLLSYIQQHPGPNPSGLNHFLFGNAASISESEVLTICIIAGLALLAIFRFFVPLRLICFNPDYAETIGVSKRFYTGLLRFLLILSIAISLQTVGVVMAAALLIIPATGARMWTHRLNNMVYIAGLMGAIAGLGGTYMSYHFSKAPTGPWVVIFLSFFAIVSIFFSPTKGVVANYRKKRRNQFKIDTENTVKRWWELMEDTSSKLSAEISICNQFGFSTGRWKTILRYLAKQNWIVATSNGGFELSVEGKNKALKIIRLHRLWELYLAKRLSLPTDHVHNDAEAIEHIITPEIEAFLERDLDHPQRDPHNSIIPQV